MPPFSDGNDGHCVSGSNFGNSRSSDVTCCWLASYVDGALRTDFQHHSGSRRRWVHKLPAAAWIRDALNFLPGSLSSRDFLSILGGGYKQRSNTDVHIRAILTLDTHGCCAEDTPGAWDRESEAQLAYYCDPADAYDVRVRQVQALAEPQHVLLRVANSRDGSGLLHVRPSAPLFTPYWGEDPSGLLLGDPTPLRAPAGTATPNASPAPSTPLAAGMDVDVGIGSPGGSSFAAGVDLDLSPRSSPSQSCCADQSEPDAGPEAAAAARTVGAQLEGWCWPFKARDMLAILVPEPICELILHGAWRHILLLVRWHASNIAKQVVHQGPIRGWPPGDSSVWGRAGTGRCEPELEDLDAERCFQIAKRICNWAQFASMTGCLVGQMWAVIVGVKWFDGVGGVGLARWGDRWVAPGCYIIDVVAAFAAAFAAAVAVAVAAVVAAAFAAAFAAAVGCRWLVVGQVAPRW